MSIKLAGLNVKGLRDRSNCARLIFDLRSFGVDVVEIQETHFVWNVDSSLLSNNFASILHTGIGRPEVFPCSSSVSGIRG